MIKTVLICGNYGASNVGDEAILAGLHLLIREAFPTARVVVMSADPSGTTQAHKVESVPFVPAGPRSFLKGVFTGSLLKTFRALRECDLFLLGGGGLFTDEKRRAIFIWWMQAFFARLFGKPLVCLGQSVGPLRTRFGRFMAGRVFTGARLVTVRDSGSQKLLQKMGVTSHLMADCAFALAESEVLAGSNSPANEKNMLPPKPYIVLTLRPWRYRDAEQLFTSLARYIDWLFEAHGIRTVLVPFQQSAENDTAVLEKVFAKVTAKDAVRLADFTQDFRALLPLVADSRFVVGTRLHSLIFSTLMGVPFLALSYSSKVRGFCADAGMEAYVLDIDTVSEQALEQRTLELLQHFDALKGVVNGALLSQKTRARYHVELLQKI